MPLYPAIALLTGRTIFAALAGSMPQLQNFAARIGLALWCVIGFFGFSLALVFIASAGGIREHVSTGHLALGVIYLVLLAFMIFLAHRFAARSQWLRAHAIAIGAVVSWCLIALGGVLPSSRDLWVAPQLAQIIARTTASASPAIALLGYQEDSAIFMLRGRATRLEPAALSSWLADHPDGIVAIDALQLPAAAAAAATTRPCAGVVDGFDYSTGKRVRVEVYSPRPQAISAP